MEPEQLQVQEQVSFLDKRISWKVIITTLVVIVLGWFALNYFIFSGPSTNVFAGNLVSIEGDKMVIKGVYLLEDLSKAKGYDFYPTNVEVTIGPETQIVKTVRTYPTREELEKTEGRFNFQDLKVEEKSGSLEELATKAGADMRVTAFKNIFNKTSFRAERISYSENYYPN